MKKALIFLVDGFEEIEALATVDVLRRGKVGIHTVSVTGKKEVTGSHHMQVTADVLFEHADFNVDLLILPGGTTALNDHEELKKKIVEFAATGKDVAAICAAPMVLGGLGLLNGKRATAYPGFEKYLTGATCTGEAVVVDGNIITGRGPGLTLPFALTLLERLQGSIAADEVAKQMLVK